MALSINSILFTAILAVSQVAAHGTVSGITANGVYYPGYSASLSYQNPMPAVVGWSTGTADQDNGFVPPTSYAAADIICHKNATNAPISATVKAGSEVTLNWTPWPSSHHGPVIDYLASCDGDCKTVDKTMLEFFKIDGVGLIDDSAVPGSWASDKLIANNNSWTVTIPASIKPGGYILRHEIIALHSAGTANGAQNYPQCISLQVTGSGTDVPKGTLGTALYKESDPGILVNIYAAISDYVVPGPALFSAGGASAASASSAAVASSAAPVASSYAPAASSAAPLPSSSAPTSFITAITPASSSSPTSVLPSSNLALPSSILAATIPVPIPTGTSNSSIPSSHPMAPLPERMTVKEMFLWLDYMMRELLGMETNGDGGKEKAREHVRQF